VSNLPRPADRITKLVALAQSSNPHEAEVAKTKAFELIRDLDLSLLTTLAGQRDALREDLRTENMRLIDSDERANKRTTGDLVSRAGSLFGHYERIDALMAIVALLRDEMPREPDTEVGWFRAKYKDHERWNEKEKARVARRAKWKAEREARKREEETIGESSG
jgi:hypothetical protein